MSDRDKSFVTLGTITRPHGFRGAFVVKTDADKESSLGTLSSIWLGKDWQNATAYKVIEAAWMPKGWKVHVEGIDSDEAVKAMRGHKVFARREALPEPPPDQYYIDDLLGSQVLERETGRRIGVISGIDYGATPAVNDVWKVHSPAGSIEIPATEHFVAEVDLDIKVVWVQHLSDLG